MNRFSLVEGVVVTAIVLVITSILLPAVATAKTSAKSSGCQTNHKQMATHNQMFADDHDNRSVGYGHGICGTANETYFTDIFNWYFYGGEEKFVDIEPYKEGTIGCPEATEEMSSTVRAGINQDLRGGSFIETYHQEIIDSSKWPGPINPAANSTNYFLGANLSLVKNPSEFIMFYDIEGNVEWAWLDENSLDSSRRIYKNSSNVKTWVLGYASNGGMAFRHGEDSLSTIAHVDGHVSQVNIDGDFYLNSIMNISQQ